MAIRSTPAKHAVDIPYEPLAIHMRIDIRPATGDDLPKLEWFGAYAHFRELYRRTWHDHQAGRRLMLVADLGSFPVGQVWLDITPSDYAYLYALRVMEPLQGLGIGRRLIESAEQLARHHSYRQVQLAVEKSNVRARQLYERLGYRPYCQRVDIWSYTDHHGETHWVQEDVYGMRKVFGQ